MTRAWVLTVLIASLTMVVSLKADSVLPTTPFSCTGETCSGTTTQLASVNGIQGVEIDFSGSSTTSANPTFEYDIDGVLSGDSLPAGTVIAFSYSFSAESDNVDGTQITDDSFVVPSFPAFTLISQSETIDSDGPCTPDPPGFSSWCRTVEGSGLLELPSGLTSGSPLDLGAQVTIDTDNAGGVPSVTLSGTVDFTAVPEPRSSLALGAALVLAVWFGRSVALRLYRRHG